MGIAKRWMEREEAKREEAKDIAVEAGVLKRCEFHDDIILDVFGDHSEAYKLANKKFSASKLREEYASRRELTDKIKEEIEDSSDGCPYCAQELAD